MTACAWLVALLALAPVAQASLLWNYHYAGAGVSGTGYLVTTDVPSAGGYEIVAASGLRNGAPLESLLAPGTYPASGGGVLFSDNLLRATSPQLDASGFTAQVGNDLVNVYDQGGVDYELTGSQCGALTCGLPGDLGTPVAFNATLVPSIDWNFTYAGAGVNASGQLITLATPVAGAYPIVGLLGARNGEPMNALLPPGTYPAAGGGTLTSDNLLASNSPFLDAQGFTFRAGADRYNVHFNGHGYDELAGAECAVPDCGIAGAPGTPVAFSLGVTLVREPPGAALSLLAFLLLAVQVRRRRVPLVPAAVAQGPG